MPPKAWRAMQSTNSSSSTTSTTIPSSSSSSSVITALSPPSTSATTSASTSSSLSHPSSSSSSSSSPSSSSVSSSSSRPSTTSSSSSRPSTTSSSFSSASSSSSSSVSSSSSSSGKSRGITGGDGRSSTNKTGGDGRSSTNKTGGDGRGSTNNKRANTPGQATEERKGKKENDHSSNNTYLAKNTEKLQELFPTADKELVKKIYMEKHKDMFAAIQELSLLTHTNPVPADNHDPSDEKGGMLREVKGDLFAGSPPHAALAHCVSRDLRMGKGIAVLFKNRFGHVDDLKAQDKQIGEAAILEVTNWSGSTPRTRLAFYLITKECYFNKPTYEDLTSSLEDMKRQLLSWREGREEGDDEPINLSMPRIGCGLDGLLWPRVRRIIIDVFSDVPNLSVNIFSLD